jgi:CheY-like chemotaxis protein
MLDAAKTILCVDDSPATLSTWLELLDQFAYRTIAITDPLVALPILSCIPVDLAILDYFMPGLDGGALAINIREQSTIPIVLASNSVAEIPDSIRALVSAVVSKQDGLGSLIRIVHSLLRDPTPLGR